MREGKTFLPHLVLLRLIFWLTISFPFLCLFTDEPAVQSVRWASCRLPLWRLHLRGLQGMFLLLFFTFDDDNHLNNNNNNDRRKTFVCCPVNRKMPFLFFFSFQKKKKKKKERETIIQRPCARLCCAVYILTVVPHSHANLHTDGRASHISSRAI